MYYGKITVSIVLPYRHGPLDQLFDGGEAECGEHEREWRRLLREIKD